jgi:hypothetical protein
MRQPYLGPIGREQSYVDQLEQDARIGRFGFEHRAYPDTFHNYSPLKPSVKLYSGPKMIVPTSESIGSLDRDPPLRDFSRGRKPYIPTAHIEFRESLTPPK